jgi:hypothetical protein
MAPDATRQFLEIIPEGASVPRDTKVFLKCFAAPHIERMRGLNAEAKTALENDHNPTIRSQSDRTEL